MNATCIAVVFVCAGALVTALERSSSNVPPDSPSGDLPALQSSSPAAEATNVPGQAPLFVRFTKPMAASSLNPRSVTLVGPAGEEAVRVVPIGDLAVVQPKRELLPASRYTLFINGAADIDQRSLPLSAIGFDTAPKIGGAGIVTNDAGSSGRCSARLR